MSSCSVAQPINVPGIANVAVRSEQWLGAGSIKPPICSEVCSVGGEPGAAVDQSICGQPGDVSVSWDSRSYLLSQYEGTCATTPFGTSDYECVDYAAGAIFLAGQTLSLDVDLSGVGCGCNAAIYLVSMPQNRAKGTCANDYCANTPTPLRPTAIHLRPSTPLPRQVTVYSERARAHVALCTEHVTAFDGDGELIHPPCPQIAMPTQFVAWAAPNWTCSRATGLHGSRRYMWRTIRTARAMAVCARPQCPA